MWYYKDVFLCTLPRAGGRSENRGDAFPHPEKEFKWKYIGAGETEHLFYAKPSSPEAVITVEVTDRFGNVYRKEL